MDVGSWLHGLGLDQYAPAFRENAVDADVLPTLTTEDLVELGVGLIGHRRKLLNAIANLRAGGMSGEPESTLSVAPREEIGERRQVTVVFADLAGYTAMGSQLDAEEVHSLLGHFFERADRVVEEHGGRIDKHIGDCVMAVFGAPVSRGNDAERAASAALTIRDAMPEISARTGWQVGVHIGVAAGQVVASRTGSTNYSEYTVTGETVNLASRLTGAAKSGEVLISEDTARAIWDRLDCEDAGALRVKGFTEPVTAWRLRGLRSPGRENRLFVGRRGESRLIDAALAACRETLRGQTIYVRGEAGIGKTRLIEEVQRAAATSGFSCHTAQVLDFGAGAGRDAIRVLVRSLIGLDVASGEEHTRTAAAEAVACNLVQGDDTAFLNDLLDLPQPAELRGFYEAMDNAARYEGQRRVVSRLIDQLSRNKPRLLVIEDLHWADPPTLAHLAAIMPAIGKSQAVLLLTSRIEGDPLREIWRAELAGRTMTIIELGPLDPEDAHSLAQGLLAADSAFTERCLERAAGNPLFLEQLIRHAKEAQSVSVPGSIQSLVQARLDRLASPDKAAIQAASVLGQRFSSEALCSLLGRANIAAERLVAHHLVQPQSGDAFLFTHALIRDSVYDTLLRSTRRELHRRAADWYAKRDPVLWAEHLERAEAPGAAGAYLIAARWQAAEYRQEEALRLVERGIALAKDRSDRFALTCLQGEILHDSGAMLEAGRAYQAAFEAAGDDIQRCAAWIGLAAVKRVTDDLAGASSDLEAAEAVAINHNLLPERARIHFLRGNLCFPRGDIEGCLREHGAALALAREVGAAELEATALGGLGDTEYARGRMISGHKRFRESVEVSASRGFLRIEVANRPMLAFTRWLTEGPREAALDADAAIAAARRVGHRRAAMIGHHAACFSRIELLELDSALGHAVAALTLSQHLRARRFEAEGLALLAKVRGLTGHQTEAVSNATAAVHIARETGPSFIGPVALAVLAQVTEDPVLRQSALEEGEALLRAGAISHNHLLFRCHAIEVCLEGGEWEEAERHASALEEYTASERLPLIDFYIRRARALAAWGRGRRDVALAVELEQVQAEGERLGCKVASPALEGAIKSGRCGGEVVG
jgi:class 3 adenylate cyclase/tetratricopeptide (TPR) repeat protein